MRRSSRRVLIVTVLGLAACGDDDPKKPLGSLCGADAECAAGLCSEQLCRDPVGDDDGDTLTNGLEGTLGTSPSQADSDGDGLGDRDELGPALEPLDSDGDGAIDALESATADGDGDCLADQVDVANAVVDPTGCPVVIDAREDCEAWRREGDTGAAPVFIDPDGADGTGAPFEVTCDQASERGGWTPLVAAYLPYTGAAAHEYLFARDGRWIRSPAVTRPWSWTTPTAVTGLWPWSSGTSGGGFACDSGTGQPGVGVGCTVAGGAYVYVAGANADPATGTARVCQAGDVAPFATACTDGVAILARRVRCARPSGELIGDGSFAALADGACWSAPTVSGASVAVDATSPPPGVAGPVLHVVPGGAAAWSLTLAQPQLTLVPGRAYQVSLWLAGAGITRADVQVDGASALAFADDARPDAAWRRYERAFVADALAVDARLSLVLEGAGGADVAAVAIVDLGPDPCAPSAPALNADAGFAHGLACWALDDAPPLASWTTVVRDAAPRPGGAAPVVTITNLGGAGAPPALAQAALTLAADRWYRLEGWFQSAAAASLRLVASAPEVGSVAAHDAALAPGPWARVGHDFLTPLGLATADGRLAVEVAPGAGATVAIDDLALLDMGPNPCVPLTASAPIRDGAMAAGVLCWETVTPEGTAPFVSDPDEVAPDGTAPSLRIEATLEGTTPRDVMLVQRGLALAAGGYELRFQTRIASPSSFIVVVRDAADTVRYLSQIVNVTAPWSNRAYAFDVEAAVTDAVIEIQLGLTTSAVWLDGVAIVSLGR